MAERYSGPGGIHIGNRAGQLPVFHAGRGYGGRGLGGRGFWRNMSAARLRALHFMRQQMLNSQYGADGGGSGGGGSTNGGGSTGGSDADSGGISLQQLQQEIEQLEQALQSQGSQPGGQPDATVQPVGQPAAVGSNDPEGKAPIISAEVTAAHVTAQGWQGGAKSIPASTMSAGASISIPAIPDSSRPGVI